MLVALKLLILLTVFAAGIWLYDTAIPHSLPSPPAKNFWDGIGITFFAYAGYGVITNAGGDVKNPHFRLALEKRHKGDAIYCGFGIYLNVVYTGGLFIQHHRLKHKETNPFPEYYTFPVFPLSVQKE